MKITSRLPSDPVMEAKVELAAEVALELDDLVDKLDEWLEVRIREEFDELRLDLIERLCTTVAVNDALIEENVRLAATCAQLQGLLERQVALNG